MASSSDGDRDPQKLFREAANAGEKTTKAIRELRAFSVDGMGDYFTKFMSVQYAGQCD